VDVTPDIRFQLELAQNVPGIGPGEQRKIPDAAILTHAHIGHYTGLMFFGYEAASTRRLPVYCSARMAAFLKGNGPWSQLVNLENITLRILSPDNDRLGLTPRLAVTPFEVPHRDEFSDTLGLWIHGPKRSLLYIPDIRNWSAWERSITREVAKADIALLDGTFFSARDLPGRDLSEIGHPLIQDSMRMLQSEAERGRSRILFTHLNHSNPAVDPAGRAHKQVKERGFEVAADGMEFIL
jgi:pyrroloquinoline quinone biosynthesis protein B